MEYATRHLIAKTTFRHEGQNLNPGDSFHASPTDAGYLTRHGKAAEAQQINLHVHVDVPGASDHTAKQIAAANVLAIARALEPQDGDLLDHTIPQIKEKLPSLTLEQLADLRAREEAGKTRATLIAAIDMEVAHRQAQE